MKIKFIFYLFSIAFAFILISCEAPTGAPVISDSSGLPIDNNVYILSGTIEGNNSLVRQTDPASGYVYNGYAAFSGPTIDGKTLIRIKLDNISARQLETSTLITSTLYNDIALKEVEKGQTLIIKVVDTKAVALKSGDKTTFLCRYQFEALSRSSGEQYDEEKLASWEFDYCRLATGILIETEYKLK